MQWLEMFKLHNNRKTKFISEMRKGFAHIMDKYVTDTMRTKITTQSDYDTKIKNDPIALLEAIRTLTHDPIREAICSSKSAMSFMECSTSLSSVSGAFPVPRLGGRF